MYCIYRANGATGNPAIHIEGRLDSPNKVEAELISEILKLRDRDTGLHDADAIILDLSMLEFISEECLQIFQRIRSMHKVEFQNCPMFIETQLSDYQLLTTRKQG